MQRVERYLLLAWLKGRTRRAESGGYSSATKILFRYILCCCYACSCRVVECPSNMGVQSVNYKSASKENNVINLDVTADRFYPVRVYDANGKLKYTVDARGMKIRSYS